ncbi:hypothetical protein FNF31_03515 [Cafeteria roenbergensis]|nr:hypothetical protein FNF31_03515 [Cafeteria roenbergensis]
MKDEPDRLSAVPVGRTDSRKPFLAGPRALGMEAFNVNASHHGGVVGCASCSHALAGFDVMRFEPRPGVASDEAFFSIMDEYFTAAEFEAIRAGVEPSALEVSVDGVGRPTPDCSPALRSFYWHWVAKEAFVKCMGLGIVVPLGRIRVRFDGPRICDVAVEAEGAGVATKAPADMAATVVEVDGEPVAGWRAVPLLINGAFPAAVAAAALEAAAAPLADEEVWPRRPPRPREAEGAGAGASAAAGSAGALLGLASRWPRVELARVVVEAPVLRKWAATGGVPGPRAPPA